MKWKPLPYRIIVRIDPDKERTEGGIVIPATARKQSTARTAVVVATSDPDGYFGHEADRALLVSVGDEVLLPLHAGELVRPPDHDQTEYWICETKEVLAVAVAAPVPEPV